jgi:two-component system sensor histidine kinase KdpD
MPVTNDKRPSPESLLAYAQAEERKKARGKLRIFLGAAPGVGKTYSMLEAAQIRLAEGLDVVAGVVETHGRQETEALLHNLEVVPRRRLEYKGITLEEFDLDGALARHPALILVDELAHTNAPGCRHAKRWLDIKELLDRGIDVYSTMNIQHLESLNDVIAQITGVVMRETVPDAVLEEADSLVLVDLPPDDLLKRLQEGKVYLPQQAEWATQNFFQMGNLIALRELALRITADRVNAEVLVFRQGQAVQTTWPTAERLLVCVGPSPFSPKLIRATKRMAAGLRAEWFAVYVETPKMVRLPEAERHRVVQNLRLAEQLGAETVTLRGRNIAEEIVGFARQRNITKLVVGKPLRPRWKDILFGSPVDELVRLSGEIDVHVITGEPGEPKEKGPAALPAAAPARSVSWPDYEMGFLYFLLANGLAFVMYPYFDLSNLIMVYLVGVMLTAMKSGRGPAILISFLSVLAFDFLFVPPRFTFAVADVQYFVTFAVMFLVALVISHLTALIRQQAEAARLQERQTAAMHTLSRQLASTRGFDHILQVAVQHISKILECQVLALLPDKKGVVHVAVGDQTIFTKDIRKELSVAQWTYNAGQMAGWGTQTLPTTDILYVPLQAADAPLGVLALRPRDPKRLLSPEEVRLVESLAKQVALALEVERLQQTALDAQVTVETERLRSSLLGSVTHDFQTPLAAIMGSASSLLNLPGQVDEKLTREMLTNIYDEAERLSRLVNNFLDIARLESGSLKLHRELQPLEEVVGAALNRLEKKLAHRPLEVSLPSDLPMVPLDAALAEHLFINLLENALKYTPPGSPLAIAAVARDREMEVEMADRGPGFPPEDLDQIFAMFYRGNKDPGQQGYGLGLSICRAIVEAHGGRIWAENRTDGGAAIRFTLPLEV